MIVATICEELAKGRGLATICREFPGMPDPSTVWDWEKQSPEISQAIARARAIGEHTILEEIVPIADDVSGDHITDSEGRTVVNNEAIARSKLRVWTRLQLLAKLNPKRWGEQAGQQGTQLSVSVTANVVTPEKLAEYRRRKRASIERRRAQLSRNPATLPALPDSAQNSPVIDV